MCLCCPPVFAGDLVATPAQVELAGVALGSSVFAEVVIENHGASAIEAFSVRLADRQMQPSVQIGGCAVPTLGVNQSCVLSVLFVPHRYGLYRRSVLITGLVATPGQEPRQLALAIPITVSSYDEEPE